jgi:hypothetical protein
MSDVFIVETKQRTAGIAVREADGYRFHAAAHELFHLDKRVYRSFAALHAAIASNDNVPKPATPRPRRRRRGE